MADYLLTRQFLEELAVFEKSVSARDLRSLEETLAAAASRLFQIHVGETCPGSSKR